MNATVAFSFLSTIGFTAAAVVLLLRRRTAGLDRSVFLPLLLALLLYDFIAISNLLEHSGTTAYLDPVEDIAEIVFTLVFLFFINNWRKVRSEARFRALFKQAPLPLAEVTREGRIVEVNDILAQKLYEYYGITIDDIPTLERWWEIAYPDPEYRKRVATGWQKRVEIAVESGAAVEPAEGVTRCRDGTTRTLINSASFVGENLVVSMVDITDRLKAEDEKNKLKEQLHQSQKLEAIGILAGGVAHDFNNMLGAIMGYAELIMDEMAPDHRFRKNLAQILNAAQRSVGLTRQLLTFARKQEIAPKILDVNAAIESTLNMLRRLIGENIELEWTPGDGPFNIRMDPSQFDQVLANLCVNARDAITDTGKIHVETRMVSMGSEACRFYDDCEPGDYVRIAVTDNGIGMEAETQEHIFEPFFTTKVSGKGTGLGLATVYGIVRQNSGIINVHSKPGSGTTFNIYFPRQSVAAREESEGGIEDMPRSRGETVLIVEDDAIVLEMSRATLQRLGYRTLCAHTPGEAIRHVETEPSKIDMFITDMVMPEMNGKDLARRLTAHCPGIKHLFMSGYTADIISHEDIKDKRVNFIRKPFSLKDFACKIREILDGN